MKTLNEFETFINKNLTVTSASIFSALFTLTDHSNFTTIIDMMIEGKISLVDISNLDIIDDNGIKTLIDNYNSKFKPVFSFDQEVGSFNSYDYLINNEYSLNKYYKSYNAWLNNKVYKDIIFQPVSYRVPFVSFNSASGGIYNSESDFSTKFNQSVLNYFLVKYNVDEISKILPTLTITATDLTEAETTSLNNLFNDIILPFTNNFTNTTFYKFIVNTDSYVSTFNTYFTYMHNLFNYDKFSVSVENLLILNLQKLSISKTGYTSDDINTITDEIYKIRFNNSTSLSDTISYIRFYINLVNTYKANNNLVFSESYLQELAKFDDYIANLSNIFKEIITVVNEKMHVSL